MKEPRIIKHRAAYIYVGGKPEGAPDFETIDCVEKSAYDALKAELEATKRDNATLNLANHLPPRPRCADCGIESLYGSVHTDECIKTGDLREELEQAKGEKEKLRAILSELIEMYDIGFPMGDSKVYFNKARAALAYHLGVV